MDTKNAVLTKPPKKFQHLVKIFQTQNHKVIKKITFLKLDNFHQFVPMNI